MSPFVCMSVCLSYCFDKVFSISRLRHGAVYWLDTDVVEELLGPSEDGHLYSLPVNSIVITYYLLLFVHNAFHFCFTVSTVAVKIETMRPDPVQIATYVYDN